MTVYSIQAISWQFLLSSFMLHAIIMINEMC